MQVAPSDLARELSNRPTVLLASAEFLASTEQSNQSRSRFQKFVNGCNLLLIPPYLLPWYWVTMNRRLDWEIRNAIETNTSVVNWEIHLRYTWCWITMNRRLDWEIRNAGETNTSVVKVRNTLCKNLPKPEEDTLGAPATMLVNFFLSFSTDSENSCMGGSKNAPLWWKRWHLAEISVVKVEIPLFRYFVLPPDFF